MRRQNQPISTLLGRFSSNKKIYFPVGLTPENLEVFVSFFSDQEKVELYCLAEYLVYMRITKEEKAIDLPSLLKLEELLKETINNPRIAQQIESMGLRTSIDRLNLGRSLSLSKI